MFLYSLYRSNAIFPNTKGSPSSSRTATLCTVRDMKYVQQDISGFLVYHLWHVSVTCPHVTQHVSIHHVCIGIPFISTVTATKDTIRRCNRKANCCHKYKDQKCLILVLLHVSWDVMWFSVWGLVQMMSLMNEVTIFVGVFLASYVHRSGFGTCRNFGMKL